MTEERCDNCQYFDMSRAIPPNDKRDFDGFCCRFPHEVPKTKEDYCGEWKKGTPRTAT